MANGMFGIRVHFAKTDRLTIGLKNRIIAKSHCAARWKHKLTLHFAFDANLIPIRPDNRKRTNKFGAVIDAAGFCKRGLDSIHGTGEITIRSGPACRIDSRGAIKGCHRQTRIIGKCWLARRHGRFARL